MVMTGGWFMMVYVIIDIVFPTFCVLGSMMMMMLRMGMRMMTVRRGMTTLVSLRFKLRTGTTWRRPQVQMDHSCATTH